MTAHLIWNVVEPGDSNGVMSACTELESEIVESGVEYPMSYTLGGSTGEEECCTVAMSIAFGTYNVCNVLVVTTVVVSPGTDAECVLVVAILPSGVVCCP